MSKDVPGKVRINLARALQYKKRIAGELSRVSQLITSNNSLQKESRLSCDVNVKDLVERRKVLVDAILQLKNSIASANASNGIVSRIFALEELKSEQSFWSSMPVLNGKQVSRSLYNTPSEIVEYDAVFKRSDTEQKQLELAKQIDKLQNEIDQINYSVLIEVNDIGLL